MRRHYNGDNIDALWKASHDVRNCMLHGDDPDRVLSESPFEMAHLVEFVGKVTWAALLSAGRKAIAEAEIVSGFAMLETNRLGHEKLVGRIDMTVGSKDPDNPDIDEMPLLTANLISHDRDEREGNTTD